MSSHHPISSLPQDASTILTAPVPTSGPHLSPILSHRPRSLKTDVASTSQPQFAELLTPQKLRRRRRQSYQSIPVSAPLEAGPSNQGFYTNDGDLFRGAGSDPTDHPTDNDDAITLSGTSVSCLSSSSTGGLERGRRATMAVLERFGTVIGVRRGSSASGSTDVRSDGEKEKRSRRLSRTVSAETVTDHPKRLHLPRKREFVLLLPSGSGTPWDLSSSDDTRAQVLYPSDRVITTSSLPAVLDQIRNLRAASGMAPEVPRQPENRAGRPRPKMPRGSTSFVAPPIPVRPARSRLQTLREVPVRPKSVSDLMGLTKPYVGSTPNLNYMRSGELPQPSRVGTPTGKDEGNGKGKGKGCWWLDVSCPGWEDLRDVGEVSEH